MKKERTGIVISDKADKTITVAVQTRFAHPKYRKVISRTKKYLAHDETNSCHLGDVVLVEESRPLSSRKRWILKKIIRSNNYQLIK
jgi:small subunit ribosomal protein S17